MDKKVDWYNLSYFQQRWLLAVIQEMNEVAKNKIPDLLDVAFYLHKDNQAAGIMFNNRIVGGSGDIGILNQINEEYKGKIQAALEYKNPFRENAAEAVSLAIWNTKEAFLVNNIKGFTLANGLLSPFYIDTAKLFAHPYFMNLVIAYAVMEIQTTMGKIDSIFGGEARGIPFGTLAAIDSAVGTGIARKAIKDHGTKKGVEGSPKRGDRAVLFEDLITRGESKGVFIENILKEGVIIAGILVVFDREQGGPKSIWDKYGIEVVALTNITSHLKVGVEHKYITVEEKQSIEKYRQDPDNWKPTSA